MLIRRLVDAVWVATLVRIGKTLLALALLVPTLHAQALAPANPETVGMSLERLGRVSAVLRGYVDRGEIAGAVALIARDGRIVYLDTVGVIDPGTRAPMRSNAIFRIASMSKTVTSVAILMLQEEGKLLLTDPVSKYIPAFRTMRVAQLAPGDSGRLRGTTVPARRPITIRQLLLHRSGLSYTFLDTTSIGEGYKRAGIHDLVDTTGGTVGAMVEKLAARPLAFEPDTRVHYSLAIDVLGRVVEVASGMPLDRFMRERIFQPLGMNDTDFYVPDDKLSRLVTPMTSERAQLRPVRGNVEWFDNVELGGRSFRGSRTYFSGGAGLFSTATDYARFAQMLLDGGKAGGVRILGPKSIELMTADGNADLPTSAGGSDASWGTGLGVGIVKDLGQSETMGSQGMFSFGGIYGTNYWVDPKERMVGVLMVQIFPFGNIPIARHFRTMAYQAITETRR
jgi:CubicO group peptidase (beta-lactamase class C family)